MNKCDRKNGRQRDSDWTLGPSKSCFPTNLNLIHPDACGSSPESRSLRSLKFSCHRDLTVLHDPYKGILQRRNLYRPWGHLSKGAKPKAGQMLQCFWVYLGKEYGSLNVNITIEVSEIRQNKLGVVGDERGRHMKEAHIYGLWQYVYTCINEYYLFMPLYAYLNINALSDVHIRINLQECIYQHRGLSACRYMIPMYTFEQEHMGIC